MNKTEGLKIRSYGASGPVIIVLHGGPAAAGTAAPLARGLADSFKVIEPLQRGSGKEPLTVVCYIDDLHELIKSRCNNIRPALVGESWGAMLALAYSAEHPESAGPLVLIGCGTFDKNSRNILQKNLEERTSCRLKKRINLLEEHFPDPGERIIKTHELSEKLYSVAPVKSANEDLIEPFDFQAHKETWEDMVYQQETGIYPAAFSVIKPPVIMLHGKFDPHPGREIRDSLKPYLPQLEYREWEKCGHSPWNEKYVKDDFFKVIKEWLLEHLE